MDPLFLDANTLFSAAYRVDAGVARLWEVKGCVLLSSDYAIEEARRNLSDRAQLERLEQLLLEIQRDPTASLGVELRGRIELPEKDWPILGGAIAAGATHLITGDRRDFAAHFGTELFGVMVLPPSDYLAKRGGSGLRRPRSR